MKDIEFLKQVVINASKLITDDFEVKAKGDDGDLVTNFDYEIEKFIIDEIKKNYPKFDIISEEFNTNGKLTKNCFTIDPIDGTINFANGIPLWTIQVACIKNGKTVAAAEYLPKQNELFWADETGAYLNEKKISVRKYKSLNYAHYVIDGSNKIEKLVSMSEVSKKFREFGSAGVSLAYVAAGRIQGSFFGSDKPWDYEPGIFIAKQAGAYVINKSGAHIAACNKEFAEVLENKCAKKQTNIFILHSLNGDTLEYWGKDVESEMSKLNIKTILPQFPIRAESSYEKFNEILSKHLIDGSLNSNSIVVAHSIGNPYFIRFCREHNFVPKHYVAVAPKPIYVYPEKRTDYIVKIGEQAVLKPDDFKFAKKLKSTYLFYSDEDDKNTEQFTRFAKDFNAKATYLKGYNHFDGYHRIYKIPELIYLLKTLI